MKRRFSFLLTFAMLISLLGNVSVQAVVYEENLYEAEQAVLHGVAVNTDHSGYTGTGFVDKFDFRGDYVQFNIQIATAGDYSMIFRYANGTGYYASAKTYFDGEYEAMAVFPDTGNWDTWGTAEVGKYLSAGSHTVKIVYNNHAFNIDSLTVEEKHESTRSFYMSNLKDMLAIWRAAQLCSADIAQAGPRLSELHLSSNWAVNQINDYSGFFRDESAGTKYTNGEKFGSEGYYDETGVLRTNYLKYDGEYPSGLEFSKDYVTIPDMNVIVSRYTVQNSSNEQKIVKILDMLNPSNTGNGNIIGTYSTDKSVIIFNRSSSAQPFIALGAFSTPSAYQVANDAETDTTKQDCSAWFTFNSNGTLKNNASAAANAVSGGLLSTLTIPAGGSEDVYFYIAVGNTLNDVNSTIDTISAHNGGYWFTQTQGVYADWLSDANIPDFDDPELTLMYKRNLIMIKNSLRPGTSTGDGAHPATTNPFNYGYKVWTRDCSVTALALDAAGLTDEGNRYWRWLAARQLTGEKAGQFNTCIDLWSNDAAQFIEPEHDTIGWFMFGVYRHCLETGSNSLRDDIWTQLKASADYVINNIDENGFGPEDFSIFEDMDNYGVYTYTQALYVAGLQAMATMARDKGLNELADSYSGAASTIKTAINRDDTLSTGLWYPKGGYYDKFIRWDDTVSRLKDGAGLILFVTGVVDIESSRAQSTIAAYEKDLLSDGYGMARYATDTYYSKDSYFSPSGDEAVELSPSWPQISNWNALCSVYLNEIDKAEDIFDWHLHRTGAGYMVTGECVSDVTEKPCVSTASEPTTAAAFILAALTWNGDLDLRIVPERSNAGCYRELTVHSGCEGDWTQYQYVPYYLDARGDATVADQSIKNVYMANDAENLYIRIDNESGSLPSYAEPGNTFKTGVYFKTPSAGTTTTSSLNGTTFDHSVSHAVIRSSNSNTIEKYTAGANNSWISAGSISNAKCEWDTTTGRIEIQVPFSVLGLSEIGTDTWLDTEVVIGSSNSDSDTFSIHYRLTANDQAWFYGDFE